MIDARDSQGLLLKVLTAMVKEWLHFGILWMIDRMDVIPNLGFVALLRLGKLDWNFIPKTR